MSSKRVTSNITRAADQAKFTRVMAQREAQSMVRSCTSCTHCQLESAVYDPKDVGILETDVPITGIMDPNMRCARAGTEPNLNGTTVCVDGNRNRKNTCGNCNYGKPVNCRIPSNDPKLKTYVRAYLCTNPHQAEHYPKGTAMRAYWCCEHHATKTI